MNEEKYVEMLENGELYDYITNLQQENQELNDSITWWNNRFDAVQRDYEDYKSRIEKAVEKLKKIQQNAIKYGAEHDAIICQELIDTLNGRSDE